MTSQPDSPATDRMGIDEYPMHPEEAPLASDYRSAGAPPGGASSEAGGSRPAQDPDLIVVAGEVVDEDTDPDAPDTETGDDLTRHDLTRHDLTRDDPDEYSASSGPELVAAEPAGTTGLTGTQSDAYTADDFQSEADPADSRIVADRALSVDLGQQWHDIQAMFVDDPRGSVELAAAAAESAVSALMEMLHQRQSALAPAGTSSADPGGTEQLREALRSYRIFCQSLTEIGQRLAQPATMTQ
jgi:hypothetical protein